MKPVIGIVGYGWVGSACAYGFRQNGFVVYVNEIKPDLSPESTLSKEAMAQECDVVFICVQTPTTKTGDLDLGCVNDAVHELACHAQKRKDKLTIVIKSTVTPNTTDHLAKLYGTANVDFAVCPEFLTQTRRIRDFLNPSRIVIGAETQAVFEKVAQCFEWCHSPLLHVSRRTAEAIKYLSNAYLVLKVAYACELDRICKAIGVDADDVYNGLRHDPRIGSDHLNPALGKIPRGSPCLPKDLQAFISFLEGNGVKSRLLVQAFKDGVMEE